jgi:3-O-methylgallate 3,4-dioxygenase
MAEIVGAIGTSHAPPMFIGPEDWEEHSRLVDTHNPELMSPRTGLITSYDDLVAEVAQHEPHLLEELTPEVFQAKFDRMEAATAELRTTLRAWNPDVVIVLSDDQEEILYDDNMPSFSVFWGEEWELKKWFSPRAAKDPLFGTFGRGWGDESLTVPVDSSLGLHVIESLIENDFDVAHQRYMREEYGGTVGPAGYITEGRSKPTRHHGMPHGFSYVVKAVMENDPYPLVPIFINTCYPPNRPNPRRCYDFGIALKKAIDSYPQDARVVIVASGGLSHFVLDEELDRMTIEGLQKDDRSILESLPRLDTPTGEIRNWITAAGACRHLRFDLVDYVPTARSAAGTGGGWTFARWISQ